MEPVFAYLDPGSASLIFQAVVAGIVAVPVIFRNRISRMVRSVRGTISRTPDRESVAEPTAHDSAGR